MVIEYSFLHISLVSSYIMSIKTLILYFVKGDRHIFSPKKSTWLERLR